MLLLFVSAEKKTTLITCEGRSYHEQCYNCSVSTVHEKITKNRTVNNALYLSLKPSIIHVLQIFAFHFCFSTVNWAKFWMIAGTWKARKIFDLESRKKQPNICNDNCTLFSLLLIFCDINYTHTAALRTFICADVPYYAATKKGQKWQDFTFRTAGRICAVGTATARGTTFSVRNAKWQEKSLITNPSKNLWNYDRTVPRDFLDFWFFY